MSKGEKIKRIERVEASQEAGNEKPILFLEQDIDNKNLYHTNLYPASWREDEPPDVVYTGEQLATLEASDEYRLIIILTHTDKAMEP